MSAAESFARRHIGPGAAEQRLIRERRPFTMESDFMDENSRPGAVVGPKSVPRFTNHLVASGQMTTEDCFFVHGETVERVYGVTVQIR